MKTRDRNQADRVVYTFLGGQVHELKTISRSLPDDKGLLDPFDAQLLGATHAMSHRSNTLPHPPQQSIAQKLGWPHVEINWLAGDGSDRCYFRLKNPQSQQTYVLMQLSGDDAKQLKGDDYEWIKVGKLLHTYGIYAPQTIATLPDFAAIIIEDYGDTMMETAVLNQLKSNSISEALTFYRKSFDILGRFLQIEEVGESRWKQRSFDEARFNWELHFFKEHFLENVLDWTFTSEEQKDFSNESIALAKALANQSKYFVHRDFHSRNVMVKGNDLAVIDFQDARLGPPTYDLVSLCFDSYIPIEFDQRLQLVNEGIRALCQARPDIGSADLEAEWPSMLLQRQLKAIGSFGYLTVKKNRGNYLKYINPAFDTLPSSKIFNENWPFLSGRLLDEMKSRWIARESAQ